MASASLWHQPYVAVFLMFAIFSQTADAQQWCRADNLGNVTSCYMSHDSCEQVAASSGGGCFLRDNPPAFEGPTRQYTTPQPYNLYMPDIVGSYYKGVERRRADLEYQQRQDARRREQTRQEPVEEQRAALEIEKIRLERLKIEVETQRYLDMVGDEYKEGIPTSQSTLALPQSPPASTNRTNLDGAGNYVGDLRNGKRHGFGTLKLPNGTTYVGDWADDRKHGFGTMYYSHGEIYYSGYWCHNARGPCEK